MDKVLLNAEKRITLGKTQAAKLRREGIVPAVCYKHGEEALPLKVNARELNQILHTKAGENVLITLVIPDADAGKERTVLIKEIQSDPLKGAITHVDFHEISLTEKITVKVPVQSQGEAKEVIREGGVIEHILWELEVECLPTNIPEKIQIQVAGLKINDAVLVKDVPVPEGVTMLTDPDLVVLTAKPPKQEDVAAEVPEGEETAEPEIIAKGKKPEEGEEGEEGVAPAAD